MSRRERLARSGPPPEPAESGARLRGALLLILLGAFALRVWAIDAQGVWGDEAFSIYTAAQPLSYVLSAGTDVHPPLYHLLLHFWLELAGRSPLAVRFLSAWWSLLVVAAGFALARLALPTAAGLGAPAGSRERAAPDRSHLPLLAGGRPHVVRTAMQRTGGPLLAAFLLAISPFQIYYAQETRMYMQAAALCALSLLFFVRGRGGRRGALLPWFVVTLQALYTHYFAFFILAAQDLWLLLMIWRARRGGGAARAAGASTLRAAIATQALMALLYLPWVAVQSSYLAGRANARAGTLSVQGIGDVIGQTLGALFAGTTIGGAAQVAFALLCIGLAALGWFAARKTALGPLCVLCIVVPIAGAIAVNPLLPYFRERFLLIASPAFVILMACGVEWLAGAMPHGLGTPKTSPEQGPDAARESGELAPAGALGRFGRPARLFILPALMLLSAFALGNYWLDPSYHKGEYDQAIAAIRAGAQPGDAVLIYTPIQDALYDYYRIPGLSVYALPRADLDEVRAQHPRAWLLLYGDPAVYDPTHAAETALSAHGFKSFYRSYRDGALARYDFAPGDGALSAARIGFGDAIILTGFSLPAAAAPGGTLPVSLQWQATRLVPANYTVFVHLLGADGKVAAQMDTQPAGGTRPTTTWHAGEAIRDNVGIALPTALARGVYRVELGMYGLSDLRRLPVADPDGRPVQDDAVVIGSVEVR